MTPAGLALIGVPVNSSGTADGVARGPAVLRQGGLAATLTRYPGFTDAGDLVLAVPVPLRGPSGLLAEDALMAMIGHVAQTVGAARGRGQFPLLLGGDCPVILGALAASSAGILSRRWRRRRWETWQAMPAPRARASASRPEEVTADRRPLARRRRLSLREQDSKPADR
jgi:hypothetical protein